MLSEDSLFSIMLEMDIKDLEAMCIAAHMVSKLCHNHFWNTKIKKDLDMDIMNGSIVEYKLIKKAYLRAETQFVLIGSVSLSLTYNKLYAILPPHLLREFEPIDKTDDVLELVPSWKNIDGKKYAGFIEWHNKQVKATRKDMLTIYAKYIYLYRKILLK